MSGDLTAAVDTQGLDGRDQDALYPARSTADDARRVTLTRSPTGLPLELRIESTQPPAATRPQI